MSRQQNTAKETKWKFKFLRKPQSRIVINLLKPKDIYICIYIYIYIYVPSVLTFRKSALLTRYTDGFHIVSGRKSVVALNSSDCVILIMETPCVF